jgi:tetratricopeptide (TPR) repeat protein
MVKNDNFFKEETSYEVQKIKDRLLIFSEELELAKKWNRPSILIATYKSEYVRNYAEGILQAMLAEGNDTVIRYKVRKGGFDVPSEIRGLPSSHNQVYFISDLRRGGGKSGRNAYRALNVRREILIEEEIRAVFWLTEVEAHGLPRFAPDFWAFRHRVIKLDDFYIQSFRDPDLLARNLIWHDKVEQGANAAELEHILNDSTLLAKKIAQGVSGFRDMKQLYLFAYTLWKRGSSAEALSLLTQAQKFALDMKDMSLQNKILSGMGIVLLRLQRLEDSLATFEKACVLDLNDATVWNNLSVPRYLVGRVDDAISAIKKAIDIKPKTAIYWRSLGSVYFDLGYLDDARLAFQRSVKYDTQDPIAWYTLGTILGELENIPQARHAFRKANKIDASFAIPDLR